MSTIAIRSKPSKWWTDLSHRADLDPLRGFLVSRNYGRHARTMILGHAADCESRPGCLADVSPEWLDPSDLHGAEWALAECRDKVIGDFLSLAMPSLEAAGWEVAGFDARGVLINYEGRTIRLIAADIAADDLSFAPSGRLSVSEQAARNAERVS